MPSVQEHILGQTTKRSTGEKQVSYQPKLNMNLFKNKRYQKAAQMLETIWFYGDITPFTHTFEEVMKETGLSYEDVYSIQMYMLTFNS